MDEHNQLLICALQQSIEKMTVHISMTNRLVAQMYEEIQELKTAQMSQNNSYMQSVQHVRIMIESIGMQIATIINIISGAFSQK